MFETRQLDYKATRKQVMQVVEKYERCLMRIETGKHPKITQSYDVEMPAGGEFNSKTENAAIYMLEGQVDDRAYVCEVVDCIKRMNDTLIKVFVLTYLMDETHVKIASILNISASQLSILKREATEYFAYGMEAEVFEPE